MQTLTAEQIVATIDLAEMDEVGTYEVPVNITSMPEGCTYTGEETVQIILTLKKEAENDI